MIMRSMWNTFTYRGEKRRASLSYEVRRRTPDVGATFLQPSVRLCPSISIKKEKCKGGYASLRETIDKV